MVVARRPPKISALIGTPSGFCQSGSIVGHWEAGEVNRALGWAAFAPVFLAISGVHSLPCQSINRAGGFSVIPSHHTPPSGVKATLVKMVFLTRAAMPLGFIFSHSPVSTPKIPVSPLLAQRPPPCSLL